MESGHLLIEALMSGVALGLVYALVAMGFTLTTGVMNYMNFAHGQLTMLAMYGVYVCATTLQFDPYASIIIVVPLTCVAGAVIYLLTGRWAAKRPDHGSHILVTLGVLLAIQSIVSLVWGSNTRIVTTSYTSASYHIGDASIGKTYVWGGLIALAAMSAVFAVMHRTHLGRVLRATAGNRTGALLCGINVSRTFLVALVLSAALEAIAGVTLMVVGVVDPTVGFNYMLRAFVIAVVAGLGSIGGAVAVGVLFGLLEAFANLEFGSDWSTLFVFGVMVLLIALRPSGLFEVGSRTRRA
jgi:branched-chain amino acid transport system permease protein